MAKQTYPDRRGKPGARYLRTAPDGAVVRLVADDDGLVHVTSDAEQRVADAFGLAGVKANTTKES